MKSKTLRKTREKTTTAAKSDRKLVDKGNINQDRQYNGNKNVQINELQNNKAIHIKTKIWRNEPHKKPGVNSSIWERYTGPGPLLAPGL